MNKTRKLAYPLATAAVVGSAVLSGCQQQQQQQRLSGAPLPPPEVQEEAVQKPGEKNAESRPQRLVGSRAALLPREKGQPLPGKKRATR